MNRSTVLLAIVSLVGCTEGVEVEVRNSSGAAVESVVIEVTGVRYELGRIEEGEAKRTTVHPTGESTIRVFSSSLDSSFARGPYLEPGYRGAVRVVLEGDSARIALSDVTVY